MKNRKTNFHPIKLIGALVFLLAFTLNIQTSLNGEWELVNVGIAQGSGGSGGSGGTCQEGTVANQCCPYWDVEVEVGGGWPSFPKVTCKTGGAFKCKEC